MRQRFSELTIKNDFMFGAVMTKEENCRGMLELVLPFPIGTIEVQKQKSLVFNPEYKGVRLDVCAIEEVNARRYNIEMQAVRKRDLERRSRYYSSQIDMDLLRKGTDYSSLADTYVIFVCDFDPFGAGRYMYSFHMTCAEETGISLLDGRNILFLSTKGTNDTEVSPKLVQFLKYVGASLEESEADYGSAYVAELQRTVRDIRQSRDMEERYMTFELLMQDKLWEGLEEGRKEGELTQTANLILRILQKKGSVSQTVRSRILRETNLERLDQWHDAAVDAATVEQFVKENLQ